MIMLVVASTLLGLERTRVSLSGTVQDPSGAVISGVHVDAKLICKCSDCPDADCKCCPGAVSATTNESGEFRMSVVPGPYEITVSGPGVEAKTVEADVTAGPTDVTGGANRVTITVNRSSTTSVH
jgi:protocatechuate 3,4-dioxygenase beta subunit